MSLAIGTRTVRGSVISFTARQSFFASSSSTTLPPLAYPRRQASTAPRLAEQASSTTTPSPSYGQSGLEEADKKIAEARMMVERAQRQRRTFNPKTFQVPFVFVQRTTPPFQWRWLEAHRGTKDEYDYFKYAFFGRDAVVLQSRQSYGALLREGVVPGAKRAFPLVRSLRKMASEFLDHEVPLLYEDFCRAQAEKNRELLKAVACDDALRRGMQVAMMGRRMSWRIKTKEEGGKGSRPQIRWAATAPFPDDPDHSVAQICVRFDTTQVLTTHNGLKPPVEHSRRVVEYLVLEKIFPDGHDWRIKSKVEVAPPDWVQDWEKGKAITWSQYLLSCLPSWLRGSATEKKP